MCLKYALLGKSCECVMFWLTVHLQLYSYNKPTRCTIFHFITLPRLYMFRAPTVAVTVKQVPFATLYTRPSDDGLQMGPKHVEAW
jgi:hypothetical protein